MSEKQAFVITVRPWASNPAETPEQAWIAFSDAAGPSHFKGTGRTAADAVRDWLRRNETAWFKVGGIIANFDGDVTWRIPGVRGCLWYCTLTSGTREQAMEIAKKHVSECALCSIA